MIMSNIKDHQDYLDQTRRSIELKYTDAIDRIKKTIFKLN